ncbi:hypothetical protein [Niameybacter massiliensis]|uniref:hypothetical protein n=1 Tax=Niameybacter massiliensis TaxID=1658108 RepID=UPI0006B47A2E|nr:hypothetical protein [Niameybacter massiliensis]
MRLGSIEVCYISYNKSQYQIAREEMAKVTLSELKSIVVGASFLMATTVNMLYAKVNVNSFTDKVNTEGYKVLGMLQAIGYWAAIVFAGIDIVKNFKKQDISGIISTVLKYFVAVAVLYGLPDIFDLARSFFD